MVDKLKKGDRGNTQRNRINDAIDSLNTAIADISNITGTETTFSASVCTTFCMGDVTTPVGTYATAVESTTGETLASTQTQIDRIILALAAVGIITEA